MEALSFAHCSLDDEKAVALADLCRLTKLKTMDLAWNRSISADGWRQLLSALPVAMEDLCFSGCSLDDAKVAALAPEFCRLTNLKKVDFRLNRSISADGWRRLLSGLPVAVENLQFQYCALDDERASALALQLSRFSKLKIVNFYDSPLSSASGSSRC